MKKIALFSGLLLLGLLGSQLLPLFAPSLHAGIAMPLKWLTMLCLAFIMIHVGLEFDIDKSNLKQYGWDYVVAATAAGFPWIFCALYFIYAMSPQALWTDPDTWKQSFLLGRFSAPTSAGILFTMLIAAGLGSTWVFRKARILAIFDDLDTVLLLIPLKMMMVGLQWQFAFVVAAMAIQLWLAWKYLHRLTWKSTWPWVMGYSAVIVLICEGIYLYSRSLNELVPVHIEVLLPAFVLGCMLSHSGSGGHAVDQAQTDREASVATSVSALFMLLVGLSMPAILGGPAGADAKILGGEWPGWGMIIAHVALITVLSNMGKMFPVFCYRGEASFRERMATAIAMFPRGEVGAGVLVVSLSYGIGGPAVTVAMLSLALNLLCTGLFIAGVRRLLASDALQRTSRSV